jgi:hypothetical protein
VRAYVCVCVCESHRHFSLGAPKSRCHFRVTNSIPPLSSHHITPGPLLCVSRHQIKSPPLSSRHIKPRRYYFLSSQLSRVITFAPPTKSRRSYRRISSSRIVTFLSLSLSLSLSSPMNLFLIAVTFLSAHQVAPPLSFHRIAPPLSFHRTKLHNNRRLVSSSRAATFLSRRAKRPPYLSHSSNRTVTLLSFSPNRAAIIV